MSTEFFHELEHLMSDKFNLACSVTAIDDNESRFLISISFADFSLTLIGSDARVCLRVKLCNCEKHFRDVLISAICINDTDTKERLKPYNFSTWKNVNENYNNIPSTEVLMKNEESYIEICTAPCDITSELLAQKEIKKLLIRSINWITSYTSDPDESVLEGNKTIYYQSKVERSVANRKRCIEIFGVQCRICEIKLSEIYGDLADGFIHVHHIESISKNGPRWINPSKDLIPVCPNCHSMLHRNDPPMMPNDLRKIMKRQIKERP